MKVELINITKLIPFANNPRENDRGIEKVAASIKEFGFQQPIVVDANGVIIVGHTRYKAALELGLTEVPVVYANNLTDGQVKAYRLADNKTAEFAEWNADLLAEELDDLEKINFDMVQFGFEGVDAELIDDQNNGDCLSEDHVIMIDKTKVILTDDEYEDIMHKLDLYIDGNGVSFGFVRWLLNDC